MLPDEIYDLRHIFDTILWRQIITSFPLVINGREITKPHEKSS